MLFFLIKGRCALTCVCVYVFACLCGWVGACVRKREETNRACESACTHAYIVTPVFVTLQTTHIGLQMSTTMTATDVSLSVLPAANSFPSPHLKGSAPC